MKGLHSIGRAKAVKLAASQWWVGKEPLEIALFQMFTEELCLPFPVFHEAIEKALGRPVFTHELGLNWNGLQQELLGERKPPTLNEIIELIPVDKRIIIAH